MIVSSQPTSSAERTPAADHSTLFPSGAMPWELIVAATLTAFVAFWTSLARITTFDESYWLVFARRVLSGDLPYVDIMDNKGPLTYVAVGLLDALPGTFDTARALVVAGTTGVFFVAATFVDADRSRRHSIAIAGGASAFLLVASSFAVTTELFAATFIVLAIAVRHRSPIATVLAVAVAAGFDPRAAIFLPAVLLAIPRERRSRGVWVVGALIAVAVLVVLAAPDLRFSLLGLSSATRFLDSWTLRSQITLGVAAWLPAVILATYTRAHKLSSWSGAIALAALIVGAVSLFPFGHYWTYVAVFLPTLPTRRGAPGAVALLLVGMLIPFWLLTRHDVTRDEAQIESVRTVRQLIRSEVDADDSVLVWSGLPHTSLDVAGQTVLDAPTINYLGWDSSRSTMLVKEFATVLESADVIVIESPLQAEPESSYQPALDLINAELRKRGCPTRSDIDYLCRGSEKR